jgi:hypothetical protein
MDTTTALHQLFGMYFLSDISTLQRLLAYSDISLSVAERYDFGHLGTPGSKDKFLMAFLNAPYISTTCPCSVVEDLGTLQL